LPNGKRIRERRKSPLTSKSATQRWAEQRERELFDQAMAPEPTPEKKHAPTVAVFAPRYMAHCEKALRQKASTLESKTCSQRKWILPVMGELTLDEITTARVNALKAELSVVGWSAGNNVLRCLSNMLVIAIDELCVLDAMPCRIKTFKRVRVEKGFYNPAQLESLYAVATPSELVALLLGSHAGLRCGEVIALQRADIDWERNRIHVQRSRVRGVLGLPKGNRPRWQPMTARLRAALAALPPRIDSPWVLHMPNGLPLMKRSQLSAWFKACEQRAGFEAHGLTHKHRHSYASNLAETVSNPRVLMELCGHASIVTTQGYIHAAEGAAGDAVKVLDRPVAVSTTLQDRGEIVETPIAKSANH
jgi:integrase